MLSTEPLLSVKNLVAHVGEKSILRGSDLDVNQGEIHVIMGPNGAGKSTLGHAIMGNPIFEVDEGSIIFDGQDITELSVDKRSLAGIFLSFQAPVEIPGVPLTSFLRAVVQNNPNLNLKGKKFRQRCKELAELLDMNPENLDRELGVGFSGGEKKKIEMIQLLLMQPKLAILDETDSGLDVDALGIVSKGMELYRKTCNGTLIIITHNTRILEHLNVDKVHILMQGKIVASGPASLIEKIDSAGFEQFEDIALED